MGEINIGIIDEMPQSEFGLKTEGQRLPPMHVTVDSLSPEALQSFDPKFFGLQTEASLLEQAEQVKLGEKQYFTAKDPESGKIVGYTSVDRLKDNELFVKVLPEYRGREIGPQLIRSLQAQYDRLTLTNTIFESGQIFYESLGFKTLDKHGHMSWDKEGKE